MGTRQHDGNLTRHQAKGRLATETVGQHHRIKVFRAQRIDLLLEQDAQVDWFVVQPNAHQFHIDQMGRFSGTLVDHAGQRFTAQALQAHRFPSVAHQYKSGQGLPLSSYQP